MKSTKPWWNRDVILWKNSTGSYCKTSVDILERNNSNNTIFFTMVCKIYEDLAQS